MGRNTWVDGYQCDCHHLQRSQSWMWTLMSDLASTDCQVLKMLMDYPQCTGNKGDVILGVTVKRELNSFTMFSIL